MDQRRGRDGANLQQITADVWPEEGYLRAVQLFQQGIHELNTAVTDATGWRGTIMTGPGIFAQEDPATPCPKILVRVLGEPRVELVTDG